MAHILYLIEDSYINTIKAISDGSVGTAPTLVTGEGLENGL